MGCFGKCNCGCCLSESELDQIALTVEIDFGVVTTHEFTQADCCWSASELTGYTDYAYTQAYLVQTSTIDESAQVSTKITQSKKIAYTGWTIFIDDDGFCILSETQVPPPADICSEEVNCGTVLKTSQDIEKVYAAIAYRVEEVKVAVHKALMICEPNGPTECRYLVECAVRFSIATGGYLYSSYTYTNAFSNEFTCCERLDCGTEKPTHDEDFSDDPTDIGPGKWAYGNPTDYWMLRYKTYDAIEDIPDEITFTDADINTCTTAVCLNGGQYLVFDFEAEPFDVEGNSIAEVPFTHFCEYCLDYGIVCSPTLNDQPCVRPTNPPFPCDCEDGTRFDANNLSQKGTGGSLDTSFNAIVGTFPGRCDDSPCHKLTEPDFYTSILDCVGTAEDPGKCYSAYHDNGQNSYPGVMIADRTICNWWECQDCYFTGADPVVPPYQEKFSTVDAYSFNHTFLPGTGAGVEITFPTVIIRFNR